MAKKLEVAITGDPKGLSRAFGDAERRAGAFDSKMSGISGKLGGTFATLGKGLGFGLVGGVGLLAAYGPQLVELGGQLETWRLKADTVFEGQAATVRKWADKNNEAFGLTDEELTGLAASFGDLLKPMGFTSKQASEMSTDVVGLAGALSQWSGGKKSAAEATEILAKAMLGEREGLVELGIKISEADVQARLAKKGQEGLTGAALEQAKALATQELIFEKSTDAQAAYAKGGNKTIMASNKLKAIFGEVQVWLAEKLIPAFVVGAEWLGDKLPKYIAMAQAAFGSMFNGGDGTDVGTKAQSIFAKIQAAGVAVVGWIRTNWPQIKATVSEVMLTVQTVVESTVSAVQTIWTNHGEKIVAAVRGAWNNIRQIISGQLEIVRGIFTAISSALKGDWSGVWEGIKQIVHGAFNVIVGIIKNAGELLRLAAKVTLETLDAAWRAGWEKIKEAPSLAWEGIKTAVAWGSAWVLDQLSQMPGKIASATDGMWDGIKEAFKAALNWIIRRWNDFEIKIPGVDPPGPGPSLPGMTIGMPQLPEFHRGGVIPGPKGREVPIMGLGGERVLSPSESKSYDAGPQQPTVVQLILDGRQLAEVVIPHIARKQRNTGTLGFNVPLSSVVR